MSQDKSLRSKVGLRRQRNVLTRAERLVKLREDGRWKEGDSIFGLHKVRVEVIKRRAKAKKEEKLAAAVLGVGAAPEAPAAEGKAAPGKPEARGTPGKPEAKPTGGKPGGKAGPGRPEGKAEKRAAGAGKK